MTYGVDHGMYVSYRYRTPGLTIAVWSQAHKIPYQWKERYGPIYRGYVVNMLWQYDTVSLTPVDQ